MNPEYPLGESAYPHDFVERFTKKRRLKRYQHRGHPQLLTLPVRVHRGKVNGEELRPEVFGRCVKLQKSTLQVSLIPKGASAFLEVVLTQKSQGVHKIANMDLAFLSNHGGQMYLFDQTNAVNITTQRIRSVVRAGAVTSLSTRFVKTIANVDSFGEFFQEFFQSIPGSYEIVMLASTMMALLPESRCKVGIQAHDDPLNNFVVFDVHEIGYHLINLLIVERFNNK